MTNSHWLDNLTSCRTLYEWAPYDSKRSIYFDVMYCVWTLNINYLTFFPGAAVASVCAGLLPAQLYGWSGWLASFFHICQGSCQTCKSTIIGSCTLFVVLTISMHFKWMRGGWENIENILRLRDLMVHCSSERTQAAVMPTVMHFKKRHFWQLRRLATLT